MALTKTELFLLREVFPKVKYDKLNKQYIIHLEDYLPLGLSKKAMKRLEEMCKENNIELEKLPRSLSNEETNLLFKEYLELKQKLLSSSEKERQQITQKMIDIRNKIAEGYLERVYVMISKHFPNFDIKDDKEDIYQMGYEALLNFIETYDITRKYSFINYINQYLVPTIARNVGILPSRTLSTKDNTTMIKLSKAKDKLSNDEEKITSEVLSEMTGLSEDYIDLILELEKNDIQSIEEIPDQLIPDELEDIMIAHNKKEKISKIIDVIPPQHQKALILYYGLNGNKPHNQAEVARIMGTTREAARQHILSALRFLKYSLWKDFLIELYEDGEIDKNITNPNSSRQQKKRNNEIEIFLIRQLPKTVLLELINKIHSKHHEILLLYLGLIDGKEYTQKEIAEKFNVSQSTIEYKIQKAIAELKKLIAQMYKEKYKETPRYDKSYIENMAIDYLNGPKRKH